MRRFILFEQGAIRVTKVLSENQDDTIPEHTHDSDELVYVLNGRFKLHIEGFGDSELSEGGVAFIPKGVKHWGVLSKDCILIAFFHP